MPNNDAMEANATFDAFARELTELSRKRGLWFASEPSVSVVEGPDTQKLRYVCDGSGKLMLDGLDDSEPEEQVSE